MRVSFATERGDPAVENEDFVAASADTVVVLDGVTPLDRGDTGCRHGVAWFSRTLGLHLLHEADSPAQSLQEALAAAIVATAKAHDGRCDLGHPDSPASTVTALRFRPGAVDYLVLSDSVVLLDTRSGLRSITDGRGGAVGRRTRERLGPRVPSDLGRQVRAHRNRPDGYWVAAEDPRSVREALTGTLARSTVRGAVLATDGATRLVEVFGRAGWPAMVEVVRANGPRAWLDRTRAAERSDSDGTRWPRGKVRDDATVALVDP